jgi:uncharacterized protein YndB with AHSA1/START domain
MNNEPFVIERSFAATMEEVWQAITDKDQMKEWYFDLAEFKAEPGFEFSFYGGDENNQWLHLCRVTEVVPARKLVYGWRYEGFPGQSYVSFELFPEGEGTRLKLTHEGLESFQGEKHPGLKKENFAAGWTDIIGRSLKAFLEKA